MAFGKHKLFERISPKKTWEGSIGGLIFGMVMSWVLSIYFNDLSLLQWLSIGLITIVFGTFGDLAESMIKRSMNVKDSGKLLPGHGGLLDRFDAALLAAPAVFIYLVIAI
jgi:phosphatidate cytidylyltransferase